MKIAMIAAVGRNNELGKNNDLIWHFKEDMRFFKETTTGCAVIMGRKTFESLPKALPGRKNIVLTNNIGYEAPGAQTVATIQAALDAADTETVFIIGGAAIYASFLPLADEIYLTEIDAECADADTFFPRFDKAQYTKSIMQTLCVNNTTLQFARYDKK
ncbi:MAG: dihydrofolate reductase [Clostridia bacterium]|nr:dihydrofolate reductase [Clostridia bacterium]